MISWISVAAIAVVCLILCRLPLKTWQENILFVDAVVGLLLSTYSASISIFLTSNVEWLMGWLVICTLLVLFPVLWWMPFISQERAERIALDYAKSKLSNVTQVEIIEQNTILVRWKWLIPGFYVDANGTGHDYGVSVNAKLGNIVKSAGL